MISEKASNACGIVGTVCWTCQLIPQVWENYRSGTTEGLPWSMMLLWLVSGIPFAIYFCISAPNIILQIQPHLFMFFCGISFFQTLYYPPMKMNRMKIVIIISFIVLIDVGMEVGFIIWLRPLYKNGTTWPDLIFGIIASVLLALGLLPPYFELAKRRGRVVGINFWFLLIDSMGAWFSIISVIVGTMDIMGIVLYCIVAFMELGIFASHFIWCCRFKWFGNGKKFVDDDNLTTVCEHKEDHDEELPHSLQHKLKDNNTSHTRELAIGTNNYDYDDDVSSYMEDYEMHDANEYREVSNMHAIHGIVMHNGSNSTGSIKI